MTNALEISNLSFSYPDGRQVLNNVNIEINRGERVALLGPNGAGKTTLVMHLNGILLSDDGEYWYHGY
jgi:cobalt/nickel transport system ATP-binding protein